jgi:hypothetical protein
VEPELAPVPLRLERSAPPGRGWGVAPAPCAAGTEYVLGTSREDTPRVNSGVRLRIARPRGHHRQSGRAGDFHVSVGSGYSWLTSVLGHVSHRRLTGPLASVARRRTPPVAPKHNANCDFSNAKCGFCKWRLVLGDVPSPGAGRALFGRGIWATTLSGEGSGRPKTRPSRQPCRLHFRG